MDPVGNTSAVIVPVPSVSAPAPQSAPTLPLPTQSSPQDILSGLAATQASAETAQQQLAQQSTAEQYPLGDEATTIYKDATGKFIDQKTNRLTGQITYTPQPVIFKSPSVTLQA